MRGSLREVGKGTWQLRVYVGRTEAGKVVHRSRTFHGGKRAAEDELRRLVAEVAGERPELPTDATLGQLLDRWLAHIEADRTPYTLRDYKGKIEGRIKPEIGNVRLSKLNAQQLDYTYRKWRRAGLSPGTIRKLHAIISAACHQAVKWGILASSPTDRATLPRAEPAQERGAMAVEDIKAVLDRATPTDDDDPFPTAVVLAAITGARRGELCALRWSDLDPATGLTLSRSLTVDRTRWAEGPTKGRRDRPVPLGSLGLLVLDQRRQAQERWAATTGYKLVPDPFVLSREPDGSRPCLPDGLSLTFRRHCKALQLPWHFHDLRHFAGTIGVASGADPRTVADRLGHHDPSLTLRTYSHGIEAPAQALADLLEATLAPALPALAP